MTKNYISLLREILASGTMSQSQLAQRLGVTFAALNRWLNGHARPHPRRLVAITRFYQETIGFPSITDRQIQEAIARATRLKKPGLWHRIAEHKALQDDLLLEHTYNSTSIEGTTFNKRETEAVIFEQTLIPDKSLTEHLEVTNHAAVLRTIFQRQREGPVSEDLSKHLHKELMQGVREDAGEYSKYQRAIRGANIALTHPTDIPEEMNHLIRKWRIAAPRKTIRNVADFHVQFELIHPFGDGNGRLGRLLMTLQCLQLDFPPVVIENSRKAEYYDVLEYAQKKADGPFVLFLVEAMKKTAGVIEKYLK